jgi:hypothetical protein
MVQRSVHRIADWGFWTQKITRARATALTRQTEKKRAAGSNLKAGGDEW